jgi:hypothetical protein
MERAAPVARAALRCGPGLPSDPDRPPELPDQMTTTLAPTSTLS